MAGDNRAVIVGVNEYIDENIPNLEGAVNDAQEMRQRLVDCGNFRVEDNHYLTDKEATCDSIRKAISDIIWQTDIHDIALFYFSGHGFVDSYKNGYIAPNNMQRDEPLIHGLNMLELKRIVLDSADSTTIMILDCCHSGILTRSVKAIPKVANPPYDACFADMGKKGKFIIASSEADQAAREISKKHSQYGDEVGQVHPHGAFTYSLIEGLDGEASDEAGIVSLADLFENARQQLKELERQEPRVFTEDSSGMKAVKIAITSKKHEEYIQKNIKDVEEFYEKKDPSSLIFATNIVLNVLKASPKNTEALEYKKKICQEFDNYKASAEDCIAQNIQDVQAGIPKLFPVIEKLVRSVHFDKIMDLDRVQKNLVIHLCRASKGEIDIPTFIKYCKTFEKRQERALDQKQKRPK